MYWGYCPFISGCFRLRDRTPRSASAASQFTRRLSLVDQLLRDISSTNVLSTARLRPSSMVKRSRDQSADAPRRRCCWLIAPPDSSFHFQTASMILRGPWLTRLCCFSASWRSTISCSGDARRDRCSPLPEHILAAHALEARQNVLQRVVERVADVQTAGDVGWRDDDAERLGIGALTGAEGAGGIPLGVNAPFDLGRVECLVEHEKQKPLNEWELPVGEPVRKPNRQEENRGSTPASGISGRAPLQRGRLRPVRRLPATRGNDRPSTRG